MHSLSGVPIHFKTMNYVEKVAHSDRSWANRTPRLMGTNILAIGTAVTAAFVELLKLTLVQPVGILANGGLRTVRLVTCSHIGESALKHLPGPKDWVKSVVKTILLTATTLLSLMASVGSLLSAKPSKWNAALQYKAGLYEHPKNTDILITGAVILNPPPEEPKANQKDPRSTNKSASEELEPPIDEVLNQQAMLLAQCYNSSPSDDPLNGSQDDEDDSSTETLEMSAEALHPSFVESFVNIPNAQVQSEQREKFYQKYEQQLDRAKIEACIESGRAELTRYQESNNIDATIADLNRLTDAEVEEKMAALIWFLMYQAARNNEDFSEGAFIIRDPEHKVARVLRGLTICYSRISSHLKGQATRIEEDERTNQTHMGIDINSGGVKLPYAKAHILVIPVIQEGDNGQWLFLKPENHGVKGIVATAAHGYEYIWSVGRKMVPSLFGSDDQPHMRKERVPKDLLTEFDALLPKDASKVEIYKQATIHGVKFMYDYAHKQTSDVSKEFAAKLLGIYGENVQYATGREVILAQPLMNSVIQD